MNVGPARGLAATSGFSLGFRYWVRFQLGISDRAKVSSRWQIEAIRGLIAMIAVFYLITEPETDAICGCNP